LDGRTLKLSKYVADFVAGQGIRHVFSVPGGGSMHLNDSFGRHEKIEVIYNLHEQAAAIAADSYAQFTNELGVAVVTAGPGGTNAVTGVAGSWVESIPVLIISGQVKTADIKPNARMRSRGFQEIDIVSVVRPIAKYAVTILDPLTIRYHLEKAVYLAQSGRRGPVWLDVPLDVQAAEINPGQLEGFTPPKTPKEDIADSVQWTVKQLSIAERPVILAGYGIKAAGSERLFRDCIARLGIPVLTTWRACDLLPDDHPLYFGRPGPIGQPGANSILKSADLLLAIGARLDFGQIGYDGELLARETKKIVVDIDPDELSKQRFFTHPSVEADAGLFMEELVSQLSVFEIRNRQAWIDSCREWKSLRPPDALVDVLSDLLMPDDLLVPGSSGACSNSFMQSFRVKNGQRALNSPGFGSMGYGIPQTIGACLASGRRRTVCLNGDGGFQLNVQELEVVHRLGLPIKYFYLNNGGYGSMRATQRKYFEGRLAGSDAASGFTLPEISRIAEAYRIPWNRISKPEGLKDRVREALSGPGPFICEVVGEAQ
jgi:acetolactate synthase-1/2/3 large subunit